MPYLIFLFICSVWGASFILMDRASLALGPVEIALCRLLGGALVLSIYWFVSGTKVRFTWAELGHIALVAAISNAWPFVIQPYTMIQAGEHAYFGMLVTLVPLATILVSIPLLGTIPTRRQIIGVLGGMICMALAVYDGSARGMSPWLLTLALTVPVTYAAGNAYIKLHLDHLPALPITTLFLGLGGVCLLPLYFWPGALSSMGLEGPANPQNWPMAIAAVSFLSIVGTGIAVLMFVVLIKNQGPLFAGMVTYVVPVIALFWGQYDSEKLTASQLLAIAGVLAMVALVQWKAASTRNENETDIILQEQVEL